MFSFNRVSEQIAPHTVKGSVQKRAVLSLSLFLSLSLLSACGSEPEQELLYQVSEQEMTITVPAHGELESAESTMISNPGTSPMVIAWLAPEFSQVNKGDVIVQFDGQQLMLDMSLEELNMQKYQQQISEKIAVKTQQESEVDGEQELVDREFAFADDFTLDDLQIYSQLEIIDSVQNKNFLEAKDGYLDWKSGNIEEQNKRAIEVLDIQKKGHQSRWQRHKNALDKLEVVAPYSGLLVYEKNWRGGKPAIGQTIFPQHPIAQLPNMDKLQVKLFVLDKEAISLAPEQQVELIFDTAPEQKVRGKVLQVAQYSRTIRRGNPTKYFELTASIEQTPNFEIKPGSKVRANILVNKLENRLLVPLQLVHNENGESFVLKHDGGRLVKNVVELGAKNLHFVEIVSGLQSGDRLSYLPASELNTLGDDNA